MNKKQKIILWGGGALILSIFVLDPSVETGETDVDFIIAFCTVVLLLGGMAFYYLKDAKE